MFDNINYMCYFRLNLNQIYMDKKSKISFSEKGDSVSIVFETGKESLDYTNKKDAFEALIGMAKNKKITPEEFAEFRDAILGKTELPWDETGGIKVHVVSMGGFPGVERTNGMLGRSGTLEALILSAALSALTEEFGAVSEIKETVFKMCDCGKAHGRIHVVEKGILNRAFKTQKEALDSLPELLARKDITEADVTKLTKEIQESPLPAGEESNSKATTS